MTVGISEKKIIYDILEDFDDQIKFFQNLKNANNIYLVDKIVEYFNCQKKIVLYIYENNVDMYYLINLKQTAYNIMNEILEKLQYKDNYIYVEMTYILKESFESINILCDKIADIID
jgi:hypothetical protein